MHPRATTLIAQLDLTPHPEGGHYRELYRSPVMLDPGDGRSPRSALTGIYFLLAAGEYSAWHRVRSDEVWHVYEGDGLELLMASPDGRRVQRVALGAVGAQSGGPQQLVPAGWWQAARPLGGYVLAGCNVAPGFDFADFSFLRDVPDMAAIITHHSPHLASLL
ncbi:MAG: cupin domain-containing protein [Gemmatimonadaceae bacterium]|jgi:hypothetical protein|nr:cupin domain-containing protein [Gemmatimonadaceae bacterium]